MKKILITGANSYIGVSFENHLKKWPERYRIDTIDMKDGSWKEKDFSGYDTIYHVAGIAHSDSGKISPEKAAFYYKINTHLAIETAQKAKAEGVKQFIYMSSAIVYGNSAPVGKDKIITKETQPAPANSYGDSKLQAELGLLPMQDNKFKVVILRPPMVYGKNSKGNYPILSKLAQKLPIFPVVKNQRSMIYIENLVEFVRLMIDNEEQGIFWPQNKEYSNTSEIVKQISQIHGKRIIMIPGFAWALKLLGYFTVLVDKAFGTLRYDEGMSTYKQEYQLVSQFESLKRTEGRCNASGKIKVLVVCQYYYPEPFRISDICEALVGKGHSVTVVTGTPNYPEGVIYKGYEKGAHGDEIINGVHVLRCPLIARQSSFFYRFLNYYSFVISSWWKVRKLKDNYDVVFVNQLSPVMMAEAAISWAKKNKKRCVLYSLDLWPESLLVGGIKKGSLIYNIFLSASKRIYRNVDKIMVSSHGFVHYFETVLGIDANQIQYLPQYAEEMFDTLPLVDKSSDVVDFLFAGNVGTLQSVETIVEAARYLQSEKNIHIHIVGSGVSLENCQKKAQGLDNITFYGRRPLEEMPQFYAMADALLVTMEKNDVLSETLPGKVQSYLAAGKPVIGAIDGETARVVNEIAKCGICCPAEDATALAKIMCSFAADFDRMKQYGENARNYYLQNFQKKDFISRLEEVLRENCLS